jgi:hypothetical protein
MLLTTQRLPVFIHQLLPDFDFARDTTRYKRDACTQTAETKGPLQNEEPA